MVKLKGITQCQHLPSPYLQDMRSAIEVQRNGLLIKSITVPGMGAVSLIARSMQHSLYRTYQAIVSSVSRKVHKGAYSPSAVICARHVDMK